MKDIELPPLPEPDICRYVVTVWRDGVECEIDKGPRYTVEQMQAYARAAVEADRAQRVPDGWKLVPVEPTEEMLNYGPAPANEAEKFAADLAAGYRKNIWSAMLASTPAPAQQEPCIPAEFDVRKIMISISPGEDGMGNEVYASSVADVENLLTSMGQELEEWQLGIRRHAAQHQEPPQQERKPTTRNCPECRHSDSWGIADKALCSQCVPTETGNGSLFYPLNERHHGIKE